MSRKELAAGLFSIAADLWALWLLYHVAGWAPVMIVVAMTVAIIVIVYLAREANKPRPPMRVSHRTLDHRMKGLR